MNPNAPADTYALLAAIANMVERYGKSERATVWAGLACDEASRARAVRAANRQFRAVQRLTRSLVTMAGGAR